MPTQPITDWGTALMTSLTNALALFLGAIPKIIGFLVVLIIGWLIAGVLAGAAAAVLRAVRFNELSERSGMSGFVRNMGIRKDASGVIADIVKWFARLIVLVVAFDTLGLPAVSQVLQQLLLWLPNAAVALVVLVITGLLANALGNVVRGATAQAELGSPDFLASVARALVWGFGIVVAVNQIGIATTLVNTLFMAFVGALALAVGLSFGLGARDTAGEIVRNWYTRGRAAAPRLQQAAEAAGERVDQESRRWKEMNEQERMEQQRMERERRSNPERRNP